MERRELVTLPRRPKSVRRTVALMARTAAVFMLVFLSCVGAAPDRLRSTIEYYVDSVHGSDMNSGTSVDEPWQTLAPVAARHLYPGDSVYFARGASWDGPLVINDSGTAAAPITFGAYGEGPLPAFTRPGVEWGRSIVINGSWIVLRDVMARDAHEAGVLIATGAHHDVVTNVEATNVGSGVLVYGQYNLIEQSYFHDLKMVVNTPNPDVDYGAIGVTLSGPHNEVAYNIFERCIDTSLGFGTDGGAIELWGTADGSYVHHNWAANNDGFLEAAGGSAKDVLVAYNVSYNNQYDNDGILGFRLAKGPDLYGSDVQNFRFTNNTVVEVRPDQGWKWKLIRFSNGIPGPNTLILRNNIFVAGHFYRISYDTAITHDHNLYYLPSPGSLVGWQLNAGEVSADPLFSNLAEADFRLQPGSLAIDAGVDVGFTYDYAGSAVPSGSAPDLGAFEHIAGGLPPRQFMPYLASLGGRSESLAKNFAQPVQPLTESAPNP